MASRLWSFGPAGASLDGLRGLADRGDLESTFRRLRSAPPDPRTGTLADVHRPRRRLARAVRRHLRRRQLRQQRHAVLVLFDRVTSTNASYKKKGLLHTPNKPAGGTEVLRLGGTTDGLMVTDGATIADNILTSTNGTGKLFHQVLLPADYEVNKVGGPNYRYYVETDGNDDNGYNGSNQNGGYTTVQYFHDYGDWRIEVTPKARLLSDTFLNILWPRDASTSSVPVSLVLRNDAIATVLQADDAVVGFGTSGAITADLAYSLDAAGPTTHRLVDPAADATYWVLCGYSSLQQVQASPQGVLQFADPAGGSARRHDQPDAALPAG